MTSSNSEASQLWTEYRTSQHSRDPQADLMAQQRYISYATWRICNLQGITRHYHARQTGAERVATSCCYMVARLGFRCNTCYARTEGCYTLQETPSQCTGWPTRLQALLAVLDHASSWNKHDDDVSLLYPSARQQLRGELMSELAPWSLFTNVARQAGRLYNV